MSLQSGPGDASSPSTRVVLGDRARSVCASLLGRLRISAPVILLVGMPRRVRTLVKETRSALAKIVGFRDAHRRQVIDRFDLLPKIAEASRMRTKAKQHAKCRSYADWIRRHQQEKSA